MKLNRECPICGHESGEKISMLRMILQEGNPLPDSYQVVCCEHCGFTYADVNCSQREYNKYYNEFNIHSDALHVENIEMRDMHQRFLDTIIQAGISREADILDIGCGGGELLCFLKNNGYFQICGLDPSKKSIKKLKEMEIWGEEGNIFDAVSENLRGRFDVVTSTGVIEHIYDLHGYLDQLQQYIKKNGYLYLLAPAVESFTDFPLPVAAYFNHEHINYFSIYSMDNLLGQYGMYRVNEDAYSVHKDEMFLTALYRKTDRNRPIRKDTVSSGVVKKYFQMESGSEKGEKIRKLLEQESDVVIFGCGSYSMQILAEYPRLLRKLKFFVDNNEEKIGMSFCGKVVKGVGALKEVDRNITIAVCSMRNSGDIFRQLRDMELKNKIIVL